MLPETNGFHWAKSVELLITCLFSIECDSVIRNVVSGRSNAAIKGKFDNKCLQVDMHWYLCLVVKWARSEKCLQSCSDFTHNLALHSSCWLIFNHNLTQRERRKSLAIFLFECKVLKHLQNSPVIDGSHRFLIVVYQFYFKILEIKKNRNAWKREKSFHAGILHHWIVEWSLYLTK